MNRKLAVLSLSLACSAALVFASADWQKTNPAQWTGEDVYTILNKSPWSKTVKTSVASAKDQIGGDQSPVSTTPNTAPMPGMSRRGYGGGTYSAGTYSGRSGNVSKPSSSSQGATEVTIQWQSAIPVQYAAAKKAADGTTPDFSKVKPQDNYVIAVIGLPIRAIGGRAASVDNDQTIDPDEMNALENRLLADTELLRDGREPMHPVKVELNQGTDGRILLYFPKSDPITLKEKWVEFRLVAGHTKIEKKFPLKEMEYKGNLDL